MTTPRALVVACLLFAATGVTRAARRTPPPSPTALASIPLVVGRWSGAEAPPLDAETRRELGADAYVTRSYAAAGQAPVGLYIAYYAEQRPNVSIHSPLHCLPGTGWEPLEVSAISVPGAAAPIQARRMLVRKDLDRAVVFYWYAVHGRVLASELGSRFWLLHDALTLGRSDAALVRLSVPVTRSVDAADAEGVAFARALLPHVQF